MTKLGVSFLSVLVCMAALNGRAFADELKIPELSAPLMDSAQVVGNSDAINAQLQAMSQSGKIQMAVFTTPSLEGLTIEEYSLKVAEKWKLGKKGQDQGLLFVVAPTDHKMRMEVGYGLEGVLTDAKTRQIQDNVVKPFFKSNDYAGGILAGVQQVSLTVGVPLVGADSGASQMAANPAIGRTPIRFSPVLLIALLVLLIFSIRSWVCTLLAAGLAASAFPFLGFAVALIVTLIISSVLRMIFGGFGRSSGRGGFLSGLLMGGGLGGGFGGSGGGFGGFGGGGGSFGGGGSSSSW